MGVAEHDDVLRRSNDLSVPVKKGIARTILEQNRLQARRVFKEKRLSLPHPVLRGVRVGPQMQVLLCTLVVRIEVGLRERPSAVRNAIAALKINRIQRTEASALLPTIQFHVPTIATPTQLCVAGLVEAPVRIRARIPFHLAPVEALGLVFLLHPPLFEDADVQVRPSKFACKSEPRNPSPKDAHIGFLKVALRECIGIDNHL